MGRRLLIVEDDVLNRMFYNAVFEARGYEIALVDDGAVVMDEVERFNPDVITMDIQLPHVSGRRLIRKLRRKPETKDIPILAITAFAGKQDEADIRAAGANAYLAKPVTIEQLVSEVDAMLGNEPDGRDNAAI